jgi:hypothetical protein
MHRIRCNLKLSFCTSEILMWINFPAIQHHRLLANLIPRRQAGGRVAVVLMPTVQQNAKLSDSIKPPYFWAMRGFTA